MSVNMLGDKKLAAVRRATDEPLIDRAWVFSHVESGRYVHFVTSDHRHGWWDRREDVVGFVDNGQVRHLASCRRVKDRRKFGV